MATQRQRRRREKLQRHEFEYVETTPEGEEVVVEKPSPRERASSAAKPKEATVVNRAGRPVPKPSLQRIAKRTAIFAPLLLVLVWVTSGNLTTGQKIFQAIVLLAVFIPFSYLMDVVLYRTFQKRQAKAARGKASSGSRR